MAFYSPLVDQVKRLAPSRVKQLTTEKLNEFVETESVRARARVDEMIERFPSAPPRELSQRLIDSKKQMAGVVGGVTGVLGVITLPVDLVGMIYLQLSLMVEIATVFKVNLKAERARQEVVELFSYANGINPVQRTGPKLVGSVAAYVLARNGLQTLGRAMPFVAAPISAYLNNQHIQQVGDAAVRHYDGWVHAHEKTRKASGQD